MLKAILFFFIPSDKQQDTEILRRSVLLVRASFLTSLFSATYLILSLSFEFPVGIQLMAFNVVSFLFLPFLVKTKLSINSIGNLYVFIGGIAVLILAIFSDGIYSAIYPWIVSIPILALLVVNKTSAIYWGAISFIAMLAMGLMSYYGYEFPNQLNNTRQQEAIWITTILPGLLLIIFLIAYIFQHTQRMALERLATQNYMLQTQKNTIAVQKEALSELIEEKNYMIRILAHDVRSPLSNINGLVKLLKMEDASEKQNEFQDLILKSTLNAENLVNKVLEMDKAEHTIESEFIEVNVLDLINQMMKNMRKIANKKAITINLINQADQFIIKADPTYIQLIIENLLSNAIKFSFLEMKIEIVLSNANNALRIAVVDEGPGIHPEEENLLFEKFSKLRARPTAGESSSGLGLSLVKRYVELSEGSVWYEKNKNGSGAVFIVELPLV